MCDSILGGCFALVFIILLQLEGHIVLASKEDEILPYSNLRIRSQLILLVGLKETRFCRKLVWLSISRAVFVHRSLFEADSKWCPIPSNSQGAGCNVQHARSSPPWKLVLIFK